MTDRLSPTRALKGKLRAPRKLVREPDVQKAVRRIFQAVGAEVYTLSQYGSSEAHSHRTPGVPDLYCIHPQRGAWWWEVKVDGGKLSDAQHLFAERCRKAKVKHAFGGVQAAYRFLWVEGILAGGQTLADELKVGEERRAEG